MADCVKRSTLGLSEQIPFLKDAQATLVPRGSSHKQKSHVLRPHG